MLRIFLATLLALTFGPRTVPAASSCYGILLDGQPDFDHDVTLHAGQRQITYLGRSFTVPPTEYLLLQTLIAARGDAVSCDELTKIIWIDPNSRGTAGAVRVAAFKLRNRFKEIDPDFKRLRSKRLGGFYWHNVESEKCIEGRAGVSRNLFLGYADGIEIKLRPSEHRVLSVLLLTKEYSVEKDPSSTAGAIKIIVTRLNSKFGKILGFKPILPGPRGSATYRLNPSLSISPKPDRSTPSIKE